MTKITLYEIREYVGNNYSKALGCKLRSKAQVTRIVERLRKQNREFVVVPYKVSSLKSRQTKTLTHQFEIKPWVDIYTFTNTIKH